MKDGQKEYRKNRLKLYGLTVLVVALFGLAIACAIYSYVIVKQYGDMPISEVPLWVWWFID